MNKRTKDYIAVANEAGFVVVRVKKHIVFKHPDGPIVVCPASPSDSRRGIKQFQKDIRLALSGRNNRAQADAGDRL